MSGSFLSDVVDGLSQTPKSLPSKYFYDAAGSQLFEAITRTPEYYPTRTETALLGQIAPELALLVPDGASLIEFGSGASVKTRLLLDAMPQLGRYVPIDISPAALDEAASAIRVDYPGLSVEPVVADFTAPLTLPESLLTSFRLGFFPGSTIGNFGPGDAVALLARSRALLGPGAAFLVGVDLVKPADILVAAYNDADGVTAAFNRNLLVRINRELGGDIDVDAFRHAAIWNPVASRMEMHLVSERDQAVSVGGGEFSFNAGESIHTENSYKFTIEGLTSLAERAEWRLDKVWQTRDPAFAAVLLKT